jgi:hypothetical protein
MIYAVYYKDNEKGRFTGDWRRSTQETANMRQDTRARIKERVPVSRFPKFFSLVGGRSQARPPNLDATDGRVCPRMETGIFPVPDTAEECGSRIREACALKPSMTLTANAVVRPRFPISIPDEPYLYTQPSSQPPSSHCRGNNFRMSTSSRIPTERHAKMRIPSANASPSAPTLSNRRSLNKGRRSC